MKVQRLDHLVLTVRSIEATCDFYTQVLGMEVVTFAGGRTALHCGEQKINLHAAGHELEPGAQHPVPGSADLCFVTEWRPIEIARHLQESGAEVEQGPVPRCGACGPMTSFYMRDPDANLVEAATYRKD
ncbi:MAG TPA: VOC family protein [Abditibacteriaceae bacterium]|jgi:catechol 2,3-dioxygenase-like lactoylglutathione lyase family enzyme